MRFLRRLIADVMLAWRLRREIRRVRGRRTRCALIAVMLAAAATAGRAEAPPAGLATPCRIAAIIDGDTIEVEVTARLRVRLLDCWAPETRTTDAAEKKRGLAAKTHLEKIAGGKDATLWIPAAGARHLGELTTLGRALGHVWLEGDAKNLSERQRAAGHARKTKDE